jgi:formamidopyrimidine-DNA glycosylase
VIELDDGAYLRAHLGMNGRFRAYDRTAGEAMLARLSPGRASLALVTADGVYVWIGAPQIEVARRRDPRRGMAVGTLGPDVLAGDFDPRAAAERAAEHGDRRIAEVLLDPHVVADRQHLQARRCSRPGRSAHAGARLAAARSGDLRGARRLMAASVDRATP